MLAFSFSVPFAHTLPLAVHIAHQEAFTSALAPTACAPPSPTHTSPCAGGGFPRNARNTRIV
jgi:hypothetical protein